MSKRPGPSRPADNRPPKRDPQPPFDTKGRPAPKKYADPAGWAAIAASLPPFTAAEAAAVGRLAAMLDARIEQQRRLLPPVERDEITKAA